MTSSPSLTRPMRRTVERPEPKPVPPALPALSELLSAGACLTLVGVLVYASYVWNGGLYSDDWRDAAMTLYPPGGPGFGNAVSYFNELLSGARPVVSVFMAVKYWFLGVHVKYLLAIAAGLGILVAILVYGILRTLTVPWYHAGLIAALTIPYPWFDSTRLWDSGSLATLGISFALAGLWVALIGLARGPWWLHGFAAVLYLLSVLTYEVTLPLIAAAGVLYTLRFGRQRAWPRWGVDLTMVLVGGLWAWIHTPDGKLRESVGVVAHLGEIIPAGGEILGRTLFALGAQPQTTVTLSALAVIFAVGLVFFVTLPRWRRNEPGWGLRAWLLLGAGGLAVAALGWVAFIPATSYYTPSVFGVTNRINALAGLGLIITVYAAFGIVGSLLGELTKNRKLALGATIALGLALGATYIHIFDRHSGLWRAAYRSELIGIHKMQEVFPRLPRGTTVFTSNYPSNLTLGVPIFSATWDLNGMIKLYYRDGTLRAFNLSEELPLACTREGVSVGPRDGIVRLAPYGTARILDLTTGRHTTPRNLGQCLAARDSYPPGPLYVSGLY